MTEEQDSINCARHQLEQLQSAMFLSSSHNLPCFFPFEILLYLCLISATAPLTGLHITLTLLTAELLLV